MLVHALLSVSVSCGAEYVVGRCISTLPLSATESICLQAISKTASCTACQWGYAALQRSLCAKACTITAVQLYSCSESCTAMVH